MGAPMIGNRRGRALKAGVWVVYKEVQSQGVRRKSITTPCTRTRSYGDRCRVLWLMLQGRRLELKVGWKFKKEERSKC
jgi:hypothetical protein